MDEVCLEYLGADTQPHDPHQRMPEVANRIVVLRRRLADEIQRSGRSDRLRREQEEVTLPL